MSGPFAGAVITTFLAPAARCFAASSRLVNNPVDSNTTSTPRSFHGNCAGSRMDRTLNSSPSTAMASLLASTREWRLPSTESYFSRCASVCALVRSLTATKSMFLSPSAARMMLRPIRPKPLIPTFTGMSVLQRRTPSNPFPRRAPTSNSNKQGCGGSNGAAILHISQHIVGKDLKAVPDVRDVRPLQFSHAGWFSRRVAILPVPSSSVQEIHRQPATAARLSAYQFQHRWRRVDLDPCGVGRRDIDGSCAGRRVEGTVSEPPSVPFLHNDGRTAGCSAEPAKRRWRFLLSIRLDFHRAKNADVGEAALLRHDGD